MKISNRKKNRRRAEYRKSRGAALARKLRPCSNCGEDGPHFVPPCFGDPGFFVCAPRQEGIDV